MAVDEAILDACARGEGGFPCLRLYAWDPPAVSLGHHQEVARVVDVFAKRLQVQEKLTKQISDAIETHLRPQGVAVILQCQHFCMCYRGVKKPGSWTTTSNLHGIFLKDAASRMELFTLIGLKREIGA